MAAEEPSTPLHLGKVPLVNRDDWILARVKGKSVLHAGATDFPMHEAKANQGQLLHAKLHGQCRELVGIDLAESAIEFLREHHNITDIVHGNVEQLELVFPGRTFDVIVAGDVVEHISNVGLFLQSARRALNPGGLLLITVPNSFSIKKMLGAVLLRQERNHPDHMYGFSPMNLQQAAWRYGATIAEMATFIYDAKERAENQWANRVVRLVLALTRNNYLADELAVAMRFNGSAGAPLVISQRSADESRDRHFPSGGQRP
jgi:2-polyprenyl-3-methyl-5-hydroxy-6-metoxy-1,4-benzoquinol methylase